MASKRFRSITRYLARLKGSLRDDESAYAKVAEELQKSGPVLGLWAKALAETDGDERASKALYLRLRVTQVLKQERTAVAQARIEGRQAARLRRARETGPRSTMLYFVVGFIVIVTALSGILASMYL